MWCIRIVILFFFFLIAYSMEGGELFQRIQDRQDEGPFTERGNKQINCSKIDSLT